LKKIVIISLIIITAAALAVPIFADEITNALSDNNNTNDSALNGGNNSSISDNTTNSTLTLQQLQILNETQNKLTALITTIEGLKTTYGTNIKSKGLLNSLDQFEKQSNRLNAEINAFIQNPSINGIDGRINSFVKREAALEHKVSIKNALLLKMSEKITNSEKTAKIKDKDQKKQKTNKGQNK
jgi:hypothetical protein